MQKTIMRLVLYSLVVILFAACAGRSSFNPNKKYAAAAIQKDYTVFETTLRESHPGLYWYISKDSMDYYFNWGKNQLKDSMTENEFRKILSYVTANIHCGHTSVRSSNRLGRFEDTVGRNVFPLSVKIWNDTLVVATNLIRYDSAIKRGTMITEIDHKPIGYIVDTLFKYLSTDGYNQTHKFQTLSNRGNFGTLYTSVFGSPAKYNLTYIDSAGKTRSNIINAYNPRTDTNLRKMIMPIPRFPKLTKRERKKLQLPVIRTLRIDSINHIGFMDLNSFARGYHLKRFFRNSFRTIKKEKIKDLVIDVRGNGGGNVTNSTFITRFLIDHHFKIGDSLYAVSRKNKYGKYIQNNFWNHLFMFFVTKKKSDGHYHFGYFERHYFKPKKKNHYNGKTYIMTGGNSFSATTLFVNAVIKQDNVVVVGEETGGGSYGNSAWLIPEVRLPNTHIHFRLPLFRLVMDKNAPKTGRGIQPEIEVEPTIDAIRRGADYKLDKVMELIRAEKK